ncbi:MAG: phage minor head protein [Staphylococcus rostri]|uniref:phage minor head protein n=1 Tax=Staphylococcus rostri TaxID=522262 RepID=UPI0026E09290|nr:phage minor head protein [Staphylococcus rostri]MDO5375699.1 phage minor head protein [Staphylococcus rostri]
MQKEIFKLIESLISATSDEAAKIILAQLSAILDILEKLFSKYQSDDPHITWTEFNKYNRLQKELDVIDKLLNGAYSDVIKMIRESKENIEIENYYRHMHMFDMSSDIDLIDTDILYKQVKQASKQPIEYIKLESTFEKHRKKTIKRLTGHIANGVNQGKSYDDIADDITHSMGMSARQAKMVARTETGRAQSESQELAIEQAEKHGARIKGYWDATLDLRTRASHASMDGKEVNDEGMFVVGKSVGPAPRLLVGPDSASQNINCRCKKLLTVNGHKPKKRSARDVNGKSVKVAYQTYDKWFEQFNKGK